MRSRSTGCRSGPRERREIARLVLERVEKPPGRKRDRIPTSEETAALLKDAPNDFRQIYTALRLCGARPNELARAMITDYDRQLGAIVLKHHKTVRKVGRPRVIPVGTKLAELIEQAIGGRMKGPIFLRRNGRAWSTGTISRAFRRLRNRAGLPKDLCLYLARHEHGTKLCAAAGNKAAAEALGHANISTTQRYVHVTTEQLRRHQDAVELDAC
jgi:integrase